MKGFYIQCVLNSALTLKISKTTRSREFSRLEQSCEKFNAYFEYVEKLTA